MLRIDSFSLLCYNALKGGEVMKLKRFSLLALFAGVLIAVIGFVAPLIAMQNHSAPSGATGIIGGADAPTYRFIASRVMDGWPFYAMLLGITLVITALFCLIFSKTVKQNCGIMTTAISFGLSAVGAMGLLCFLIWFGITAFHEMSKHPISYPVSVSLGLACLLLFFGLIALYIDRRRKAWSSKGLCIDVLTSILYLPTFFCVFYYLYEKLSELV